MKSILENVAVTVVVVLFLLIIALVVQYNMIGNDDSVDEVTYAMPVVKKESKKEKASNYLENLESYSDVDVKVDPTKENSANRVQVISEVVNDAIGLAIENTDKSAYVDSLKDFSDKKDTDKKGKAKTAQEIKEEKAEDDKIKLDQDEIEDEIGNAIGAALEDI